MLDLLPHLPEVITDMWNASIAGQGWQFVFKTTENKYGVRLGKLAGEVYAAWTTSKGSEDALKNLIEHYAPRQIGPQTPPSTPSSTPQSTPITPQDPKSGTNSTQLPNGVPEGVLRGVLEGVLSSSSMGSSMTPEVIQGVLQGVLRGVLSGPSTSSDGLLDVLNIVQRNLKLTPEQVISSQG